VEEFERRRDLILAAADDVQKVDAMIRQRLNG
jgi:hypothetical protein